MNSLDASIRGIKFQKKEIPNLPDRQVASKKGKNDVSIGGIKPLEI